MWHPGAARGGGANEAYLSRCFAAPAPNFNVVDSGVWKFEIEQVIIEIGKWGGVSGHEEQESARKHQEQLLMQLSALGDAESVRSVATSVVSSAK